MIVFDPASRLPVVLAQRDLRTLGQILARALRIRRPTPVGVSFVSASLMQKMNRMYRHINKPTDVLSFASVNQAVAASERSLGDLVLCPAYAKKEAKRRHLSEREELIRLLVHGVLHLKGFDHAKKQEELRMFALQERCVEHFFNVL